MYATCLFCHKPLGANETFESFPVGKRLAFDAARGRLWVVCSHCERWNLSPLEERWEAIEQAERLYRDTRKRVATDNIGLAKLRDDTTIVRIGEPMRPEFAAWRYGDQFGRRRKRQMIIAGAGITGLAAVVVGGAVAGAGIGGFAYILSQVGGSIVNGRQEAVIAKIPTDQYGLVDVRRRHLAESSIERAPNGEMQVNLRFKNGAGRFVGREAERIAASIIPAVNRFGGSRGAISSAVEAIEQDGTPEGYLARFATLSSVWTGSNDFSEDRSQWRRRGRRRRSNWKKYGLFALPVEHRLALEMALHEEAERRAMHGELAELEAAWKSAEEIAAISDSLLVDPGISRALDAIKKKS